MMSENGVTRIERKTRSIPSFVVHDAFSTAFRLCIMYVTLSLFELGPIIVSM